MRNTDIAVVGAGPAGISAATRAARLGAEVTLIDEQPAPGGHLRWTLTRQTGLPEIDGQRGFEVAAAQARELEASRVQAELGSIAWGHFDGNVLGVIGPESSYELQAGAVVLATGSTDVVWPFRGWTLPGVMTARAARVMMHLHWVLPGSRAAIIGAGMDADELVEDLTSAGVEVPVRAGAPQDIQAGGPGAIEWAAVGGQRYEVDLVVFALGSQPDPQLARQTLCEIEYSERDGCHVPARDARLETTVPGVFVAGDTGGMCATAVAIAEGIVAAEAALSGDGLDRAVEQLARLREEFRKPEVQQQPPEPDLRAIPGDVVVCRCEQIAAAEIRTAIAEDATTLNDVKRRTRAGMGVCQGIFCGRTVARMINQKAGVPLDELQPMTSRPPARLISLGDLAAVDE